MPAEAEPVARLLDRKTMDLHQIGGQHRSASARPERRSPQNACQAPGHSGVVGRLRGARLARAERLDREDGERARGPFHVGFKGREIGRRIIDQVGRARIDQPVEMIARNPVVADRHAQTDSHGMRDFDVIEESRHRIAPPLQPNLAEQRLADRIHEYAPVRR